MLSVKGKRIPTTAYIKEVEDSKMNEERDYRGPEDINESEVIEQETWKVPQKESLTGRKNSGNG